VHGIFFLRCSGPVSQYSPDCSGMYMDSQHMMRAQGKYSFELLLMAYNLVSYDVGVHCGACV
jgi:hypothetical protein